MNGVILSPDDIKKMLQEISDIPAMYIGEENVKYKALRIVRKYTGDGINGIFRMFRYFS